MQIRPKVSFYHDTRRALKSGKYPVKIRVTFQVFVDGNDKYDQDYYKTGIALSEKEYEKILSPSVPPSLRSIRERLMQEEKRINDIIDNHPGITPAFLSSIVTGKVVSSKDKGKSSSDDFPMTLDVEKLFDYKIKKLEDNEQIGTRNTYIDAKNSFLAFGGAGLTLDQIDKRWLEEYENWAQRPRKDKNGQMRRCGLTTIGMYMRNLRHLFKEAIHPSRKLLPMEKYPFGVKGYVIRDQETVKEVIDDTQRQKIATTATETNRAEETKAFKYWLFSYYCHGMNFQDMAHLRPEDIREDRIVYVRRKTMRTVKVVKPQIVPIRKEIRDILNELGIYKPYVFGIIDDTMDAETKHLKIKNWYTSVNKWMNIIAKRCGLKFTVNSYGARHAVGKKLIEKGIHLQYIQELYGHRSIRTTQIYTSGMNIEKTKEITDLL